MSLKSRRLYGDNSTSNSQMYRFLGAVGFILPQECFLSEESGLSE